MSEYSEAKLLLIPSGIKEGKLYSQKPTDGTGDFIVKKLGVDSLPVVENCVLSVTDEVITVTPPVGVTEIIETIDNVEQPPITVIPTTYQIPQNILGSELYDGNIKEAVNGGAWTDNGNGTFTITGNGFPNISVGARDLNAEYLVVGKSYLFTAIGSNLTVAIYDSSFNLLGSSDIPFTFIPTTTNTKIYLSPTDGITVTYSDVSIKEVLSPGANINKVVMN